MRLWGKIRISVFQIIVFGFAGLILSGTLLLMLPASCREPGGAGFEDCLFTATSAVCVTGLVVRDTALCWTGFGQAVILLLIQTGGLGIITAAAALATFSGRRIGLMQRSTMQEALSAPQVGGVVRLTRFIVLSTAALEAAGALLLLPAFIPEFGWKRGAWYALFHAVSAFCNAGFDLMGIRGEFSSLTLWAQHPCVNIVLILLITAGGVGFLVWDDLARHLYRIRRYRLQSKIVLLTSAVLVLLPFLWFWGFEMKTLPPSSRILPSLFQSVTLRTAGFNTVDLGQISGAGRSIMILAMLIGGSPGSTAGGMKTSTAAVLALTAHTVLRRKDEVTCFGRRVGQDAVRSAVSILFLYFFLFYSSGLILSAIEKLPLEACLFETASALGTVGLSLGITGSLGSVSRMILITLMFLGRVGALTLIYAAQPVRTSPHCSLPLEKVAIG